MAYNPANKAQKTLNNVVIQLRNDTQANWESSNYVLAVGELGLDTTRNVIKIGDGVHTFSQLANAGSVIAEASAYDETTNPGGKDRNHGGIKVNGTDINVFTLTVADTSVIGAVLSQAVETSGDHQGYAHIGDNYIPGYVTVDSDGKMTVQVVAAAEKLYTARTIAFADDGALKTDFTASFDFDGSANITTQGTLVDKFDDDTSKEYWAMHVDSKGRVLSAKEDSEVIATNAALGLVKTEYDSTATDTANVSKVAIDASGNMTVPEVRKAVQLSNSRTFSINGAGTGSATFDGTSDATITLTLVDSSVTSAENFNTTTHQGVYTKVTVNEKGLVIDGKSTIASTDVNDWTTAVETVIEAHSAVDYGGAAASVAAGQLVKLNASGKISDDFIPNLAIGQTYATNDPLNVTTNAATYVASNNIQAGDIVVVTATLTGSETEAEKNAKQATDGTYIYVHNNPLTGTGTFVLIKAPGASITSVNTKTGPSVTLITDDIAEDATAIVDSLAGGASDTSHKRYYTQARVRAYLGTLDARADDVFVNSDHLMYDNDSVTISAGNASA